MALKKAQALISYAVQFSEAVQNRTIKPKHFKYRKATVKSSPYITWTNWKKEKTLFRQTAEDASVAIATTAIVICNESYFDLFEGNTANPETNFELHSAQMILRIVRNSMGHFSAEPTELAPVRWNVDKPQYRKLYAIKSIDVTLDARDLNGKPFTMLELGGLKNFFKVLKYLADDLQNNASKETI